MGGVSAHNLDATVYVCISGLAERWEGFCFAAWCLIRVRTIIPPSMVLIVFFSCFYDSPVLLVVHHSGGLISLLAFMEATSIYEFEWNKIMSLVIEVVLYTRIEVCPKRNLPTAQSVLD